MGESLINFNQNFQPDWNFVGALIAIIAIGVPIVLYFIQRRRKKLAYEVINLTSLLSVAKEVEGKLQILYENEPVRGVHLIELSFINNGNVPILESDFKSPVKIDFGEEAKILSSEISEVHPDNLEVMIAYMDHTITLIPTLLNSGDRIKIKSLVSGFDGDYRIEGRIVGVKNIEMREESVFVQRLGTFGILLYLISFILGLILQPEKETFLYDLINTALAIGGGSFLFYVLFSEIKKYININA